MATNIYRGQHVSYWPNFMIDPASDDNACTGVITQIDDAATGVVRVGGFSPEGRPVPEGQRCTVVTTPTVGGWMPLEI